MKKFLMVMICVWWVYLINGEIIKGKSITRGKWEPEYKIVTLDDRIVRVPFTSVLKIEEKN